MSTRNGRSIRTEPARHEATGAQDPLNATKQESIQTTYKIQPNPKEQPEHVNGSSDYAILSAASSKVDTSTLILVVLQNLRTNEKEYRCSPFCQCVSKFPRNARRHVEMKHVDTGVVFRCKVCPSTAKLKATLKNHYMKVHQMPGPTLRLKLWLRKRSRINTIKWRGI